MSIVGAFAICESSSFDKFIVAGKKLHVLVCIDSAKG